MKDSYWERKLREKFYFLYPSEKLSRVIGKYFTIMLITFLTMVGLYAVGAITWDFAFNQYDSLSDSPSVVASTTGVIAYDSKEYLSVIGTDFMLSKEPNLFTYEDFLIRLEKTCPYYEPDGMSYRNCLHTLLEKKDKQVISVSDDLVKDIQIVISEKKTNPDEIDLSTAYFGEQYFLADKIVEYFEKR